MGMSLSFRSRRRLEWPENEIEAAVAAAGGRVTNEISQASAFRSHHQQQRAKPSGAWLEINAQRWFTSPVTGSARR
jgi:hypothetical protein